MTEEPNAGSLTPTQQRLILALHSHEYRDWGRRGMPGNSASFRTICSLDLVESQPGGPSFFVRLNARGIAMKAAIEAMEPTP